MRVANKTIYDMVKSNLSNITDEMYKLNKTVATGKRITDPSDDPSGLVQALKIKSTLSGIEQLGRNMNTAKSWLTASESALGHVQDLLTEAKTLCVSMNTSTVATEQRVAAAQNVQNILEETVSLGNTDVNGRYIFAGSKTDAAAFNQDGSYNGDNNGFAVRMGRDTSIQVGSDGDAVLGTIFTTLNNLKTALENDDLNSIGTAMDDLDADFDQVTAKISDVGSKMLRMEIKEKIMQDIDISNRERLSMIEDADIAEAITDLTSIELTYKAALASSSKVMQLSLVDYL